MPGSKNERKGKLLSEKNNRAEEIAQQLNTKVVELREYPNKSVGAYFENGMFRFIKGSTSQYLEKARSKKNSRKNSKSRKTPNKKEIEQFYKNKKLTGGNQDEENSESENENEEQHGGMKKNKKNKNKSMNGSIDLKTAVTLLRQYYSEKYNSF